MAWDPCAIQADGHPGLFADGVKLYSKGLKTRGFGGSVLQANREGDHGVDDRAPAFQQQPGAFLDRTSRASGAYPRQKPRFDPHKGWQRILANRAPRPGFQRVAPSLRTASTTPSLRLTEDQRVGDWRNIPGSAPKERSRSPPRSRLRLVMGWDDNCLPQTLPLGWGRDSKSPAGSRVPLPSSKGPEATRLCTLVSLRATTDGRKESPA